MVAGEAGEMERESCHFLGVQFVVLWKNIKMRESRRKNWRRSWVQARRTKKTIFIVQFGPCFILFLTFKYLYSYILYKSLSISQIKWFIFFAIVKISNKIKNIRNLWVRSWLLNSQNYDIQGFIFQIIINNLTNIIINIKIHMYSEKKKFMLTLRGCNLTGQVLSLIFRNHQFKYHKSRVKYFKPQDHCITNLGIEYHKSQNH